MTKNIIILGSTGNCIDILDIIDDINTQELRPTYGCAGFLDDNKDAHGKNVCGIKVLGSLADAPKYRDCYFVNGIGNPHNHFKKEVIIAQTNIPTERFESIIHPRANVSKMSKIGQGTVIFPGTTLSSNCRIGNHVIILPGCNIGHDATVGDYCCLAPGVTVSGNVNIEPSCYLGANSSIKEDTNIGMGCLVGMGAVVLDNAEENSILVGNPAKKKT